MTIEPIVVFFLLRNMRRIVRNDNSLRAWAYYLRLAMYGVIALVVGDIFLAIEPVTNWIWHIIVFIIIGLIYTNPLFSSSKKMVTAFLPLAFLSLAKDIYKIFFSHRYPSMDHIFDTAIVFAVIWAVAIIIIYRKQQKALEDERKKTQEEEEQKKWMAERKAELEQVVAERTFEITQQKKELENALVELKATQARLVQQEKLVSLGELTAGIAHEIQNPLNFVNNFSEVSAELLDELKTGVIQKLTDTDQKHADEILLSLTHNLQKITHHGKRADAIVKSMMQHSRSGSGTPEPVDINALADEYLRLAYHGLRAKDKSFNAKLNTHFDDRLKKVNIVLQDISRVLLNLYNNAFYSTQTKKKEKGEEYFPTIDVSTQLSEKNFIISIKDNGTGIPAGLREKIFQPFFTTKPTGQGIGLGLSLSYDIIKSHNGEIIVNSKEGEFAEFIIELPVV